MNSIEITNEFNADNLYNEVCSWNEKEILRLFLEMSAIANVNDNKLRELRKNGFFKIIENVKNRKYLVENNAEFIRFQQMINVYFIKQSDWYLERINNTDIRLQNCINEFLSKINIINKRLDKLEAFIPRNEKLQQLFFNFDIRQLDGKDYKDLTAAQKVLQTVLDVKSATSGHCNGIDELTIKKLLNSIKTEAEVSKWTLLSAIIKQNLYEEFICTEPYYDNGKEEIRCVPNTDLQLSSISNDIYRIYEYCLSRKEEDEEKDSSASILKALKIKKPHEKLNVVNLSADLMKDISKITNRIEDARNRVDKEIRLEEFRKELREMEDDEKIRTIEEKSDTKILSFSQSSVHYDAIMKGLSCSFTYHDRKLSGGFDNSMNPNLQPDFRGIWIRSCESNQKMTLSTGELYMLNYIYRKNECSKPIICTFDWNKRIYVEIFKLNRFSGEYNRAAKIDIHTTRTRRNIRRDIEDAFKKNGISTDITNAVCIKCFTNANQGQLDERLEDAVNGAGAIKAESISLSDDFLDKIFRSFLTHNFKCMLNSHIGNMN